MRDFQKKAVMPVDWPDGGAMSVNRFLETIRSAYGIKTLISRETYEKNGVPAPGDIQVKVIKVDKMPLVAAINKVLEPANAKAELLKGMTLPDHSREGRQTAPSMRGIPEKPLNHEPLKHEFNSF